MFKQIASIIALASIVGFSATADAGNWSDPSWDSHNSRVERHNDRHNDRHHVRQAPKRQKVTQKRIERRIKNTTLPLGRMFNLGRDNRGYRVDAVIIKARPYNNRSRVKLLVNGHAVAGKVIRHTDTIRLRLDNDRIIGRDLKSLKLDVRGKVFIKDIKIKMTRVKSRRHAQAQPAPAKASTDMDNRTAHRIARLILRQMNKHWNNQ